MAWLKLRLLILIERLTASRTGWPKKP
ncbi:uncharacterized protein G2W53_024192 [Senna tora]|uniref:Uncharacterized protein n=1 Tax=Senna tora TaxID=362788 RepID=A0A834WDN9_9FABA|nr:uncharacterized protein G2W53_024192 [Senna tora]